MDKMFDGKYVVLTGVFSINRYMLAARLRGQGAILVNKLDKRIDYLIAGKDAGRRLDEAKHLRIRVIHEDELFDLLNRGKDDTPDQTMDGYSLAP